MNDLINELHALALSLGIELPQKAADALTALAAERDSLRAERAEVRRDAEQNQLNAERSK